MPLEKVRRWLSRGHRELRKEIIQTLEEKHGVRIKGRDLLGYSEEELLILKDKLSELRDKHGLTLKQLFSEATKHGLTYGGHDWDWLARNRIRSKKILQLLDSYIKDRAKREARSMIQIAPEVREVREIEYNGRKISVSEEEIASFLYNHGLKHAKQIREKIHQKMHELNKKRITELRQRVEELQKSIEELKELQKKLQQKSTAELKQHIEQRVVELKSRVSDLQKRVDELRNPIERQKKEALAIIEEAKKAGVKGVRVGDRRFSLEEIEEGIMKGSVYAYMDTIKALEKALQKSVKRKPSVGDIGRFISVWMPRGREPAPVVSKDLVHVLEKAKEIAAELEKAYRKISAYDVSHIGHANAAEAIYTALHENPEDILKGMVEALNESLYGNPRARIERYEIRGPESVFSLIEKDMGKIIKKEIENLSEIAAKQPEAAIKKMKEQRAYQIGRQLASVLLKMHELGHVHIKSIS